MKDEKPEQSSWGFDELYLSSPCFFGPAADRFLANNLAHVPVGKALDLGCGEGRNMLYLAQNGFEVTGIEWW